MKQFILKLSQITIAVVVFYCGWQLCEKLLLNKNISENIFLSLVVIMALFSIVITLLPKLAEIKILGSYLKIREVTRGAEQATEDARIAIKKLQIAKTETFRILLMLVKRTPGGFASQTDPVDPRVPEFWRLYNKIIELGSESELSKDTIEVLDILIFLQEKKKNLPDKTGLKEYKKLCELKEQIEGKLKK